ncbi:carboxymuconolactone decarboxylase family protein [Flagellimonas sp.]|uniref:carboxymuconolactone decarboxylase family protein n=1 Tax=Flagellimonas sp. TaxID=2058762 RepID=UPI003AB32B06
MAYIPLEEHLPGITGLLEYSRETAEPIRELTQILMRGPSTLSEGERELIATVVSSGNGCVFCTTAHTAAANTYYDDPSLCEMAKKDIDSTPLDEKMKALLHVARLTGMGGKQVSTEAIACAKEHGATDLEIHDTVLIAALFCLYNRYVDGLGTHLPLDATYYQELAGRLNKNGYVRIPEAYEQLKHKKTKPNS